MSEMTPREIVHELDRHIIGQADAKRMGGGSSFGKQSGNVTQREASRAPAQNQQAPQQNAALAQLRRRRMTS